VPEYPLRALISGWIDRLASRRLHSGRQRTQFALYLVKNMQTPSERNEIRPAGFPRNFSADRDSEWVSRTASLAPRPDHPTGSDDTDTALVRAALGCGDEVREADRTVRKVKGKAGPMLTDITPQRCKLKTRSDKLRATSCKKKNLRARGGAVG
jgi:hypothetical protein